MVYVKTEATTPAICRVSDLNGQISWTRVADQDQSGRIVTV